MKMNYRKITGAVFATTALIYSVIFALKLNFSIQLQSYFTLEYYMQFAPLIVSMILLFAGIYLYLKKSKTNFTLALFGHTVLEEVLFDWIGLTTCNLPNYVIPIFLLFAIAALWIAYSNTFNLKRLSYKEVIVSLLFGAIESFLPGYLLSK